MANEKMSDQEILSSILKNNKEDHFNFLEERFYKVSTSSMIMDHVTDGGLPPGLHRFTGPSECGKTRSAIDVMSNFLKMNKNGKGVYIEAEGRLPKNAFEQHGIEHVYDASEWVDGTVFIFQSNVYEVVAELMEKLVLREDNEEAYCFILDSVDGLSPKKAKLKTYEESQQVAGGAVIASNLMKRIAIPLGKRGHIAIFLSQQRATISIDPYSPKEHKLFQGSGGNALVHYSNYIFNFDPRYKSDLILQKDKEPITPSNPALGHYAKVSIKKSPNEKTGMQIRYPVRYQKKSGSSVWIEKEIVDTLLMWEEIEKKGAWFNFSDGAWAALVDAGCVTIDKQKFQGINSVYNFVEESACAVDVLKDYIYTNLMQYGK